MKSLQLVELDPKEFQDCLVEKIKEVLLSIEGQKVPTPRTEILSREEAATLLDISIKSLTRWTKRGRLKSYGLGNRVYYKRHEIEDALIPLNPLDHE